MLAQVAEPTGDISVALVDGDPTVRRERQLMLRSEDFGVRSYATCAALIADPSALASACIVVDMKMPESGGVELVHEMRVRGWRGAAILLRGPGIDDELARSAQADGDVLLDKSVADQPLLLAIRSALERNVSGNWSLH